MRSRRLLAGALGLVQLLDEGDSEAQMAIDFAVHGIEILAERGGEVAGAVGDELVALQQFLAQVIPAAQP